MLKFGILAAFAAMIATPAMAASYYDPFTGETTVTYGFTLTNFSDSYGSTDVAPFGPISGSFTVTFDPGGSDIVDDTTDIVINSFSGLNLVDPLGFTYFAPYDGSPPQFYFGEVEEFFEGANNIGQGSDDFVLELDLTNIDAPRLVTCADSYSRCVNFTDSGTLSSGYTTSANYNEWFAAARGSFLVAPEPETWAMMVGGFGLVGAAIRRKRRAARLA